MIAATLIATNGSREAWQIGDQVYIRPTPGPADVNSHPAGVRWECSRRHWDCYWPTVHEPAGWVSSATDVGREIVAGFSSGGR